MTFIETAEFLKTAQDLLGDDELGRLQIFLVKYPDTGPVIPGSGGLRKLRWKAYGKGQRGGLRIIYYWVASDHLIYLLRAYKKSSQVNLSPDDLRILRRIVKEIDHE